MADLTITASQVLASTGAVVSNGMAGATITAGQPLYKDSTDSNKIKLAVATSSAAADCVGIALHAALSGQPIQYQTAGTITLGAAAAPTKAMRYTLSGSAGGIAPDVDADDVVSGEFATYLGTADASNGLLMSIHASGVALA